MKNLLRQQTEILKHMRVACSVGLSWGLWCLHRPLWRLSALLHEDNVTLHSISSRVHIMWRMVPAAEPDLSGSHGSSGYANVTYLSTVCAVCEWGSSNVEENANHLRRKCCKSERGRRAGGQQGALTRARFNRERLFYMIVNNNGRTAEFIRWWCQSAKFNQPINIVGCSALTQGFALWFCYI